MTNHGMLPKGHIRDLIGYVRYHSPDEDVAVIAVISRCSTYSTANTPSDCSELPGEDVGLIGLLAAGKARVKLVEPTGEIDDGEIVLRLTFSAP